MNLSSIINRQLPATAWQSGEKIPWDNPEFSQRMLANHLCQEHDWASRRFTTIDQQVNWLAAQLRPSARVLDLGCGPGFYTQRLTKRGFDCVGVDFSPASIAYAKQQATNEHLSIEYLLADVRNCQLAGQFDLVMMTFGEFNVFKKADIKQLIDKVLGHLNKNGYLLIEGHTFAEVQRQGQLPTTWQSYQQGLFLDSPHLCLEEHFWDSDLTRATTRYFVIDAINQQTTTYASTMEAYTDEQYQALFKQAGINQTIKLNNQQWPTGDNFTNKLQTYFCSY